MIDSTQDTQEFNFQQENFSLGFRELLFLAFILFIGFSGFTFCVDKIYADQVPAQHLQDITIHQVAQQR